jgi:predicted NAD/FAD-dependent oxidoreductase
VVSASRGDRDQIEQQVIAQAHGLGWDDVQPLQTVTERRATFACTPGLERPGPQVADHLWACGDWVAGPYPATLEGAVLSGRRAAAALGLTSGRAGTA